MKLSTNKMITILGILVLGMMAIFPISFVAAQVLNPQPNNDPQATVQAMVTQTMLALTLNAPTQTPLPPIIVPATNTNTPMPTFTPTPTATTASYCDWAAFVKDVTVPDGTDMQPDETFTKTWRLRNRGTCTWTPDYMLVFSGGSQLSETTAVRLPTYVAPGQTVDVSVLLTAPYIPGEHTSYWMLRNPSGALFGTSDKANIPFYVDIDVKKQDLPHGTVTGSLCYPSEFNPAMTLYFERVGTSETIQFSIAEAQNTYSVLLPKGSYYVHAWAPNYNLEGAYADPNTNLMIPVQVYGGETIKSINLCNWSPNPHGRG